jgi:mono/diheme cytochrome c family protein
MNRYRRLPASSGLLALIGLAALGVTAWTPSTDLALTQDQAEAGRAIFKGKGNCFTCHGPEAKGTVLAPDLTDQEWLHFEAMPTAAQVRKLVTEGVAKPQKHPAPMLPMGGARLSDEELDQVAAYVLGLSAQK